MDSIGFPEKNGKLWKLTTPSSGIGVGWRDPDLWPFEPKIGTIRQTVEDYYCAKFRVILINGFRFIVLQDTYTHTSWRSDRNICAAVSRRQRG